MNIAQFKKAVKPYRASLPTSPALKSGVLAAGVYKTKGYVNTTYLCKLHASMAEGDGFVVEEIKKEIERSK